MKIKLREKVKIGILFYSVKTVYVYRRSDTETSGCRNGWRTAPRRIALAVKRGNDRVAAPAPRRTAIDPEPTVKNYNLLLRHPLLTMVAPDRTTRYRGPPRATSRRFVRTPEKPGIPPPPHIAGDANLKKRRKKKIPEPLQNPLYNYGPYKRILRLDVRLRDITVPRRLRFTHYNAFRKGSIIK